MSLLIPPIPPADPKNWSGWWRPFLALDALVLIAVVASVWAGRSSDVLVLLLGLGAAMVLFVLLPIHPIGAAIGVAIGSGRSLASGLPLGQDANTASPEVRAQAYRITLEAPLIALTLGVLAALVIGTATGRCPRTFRDHRRRATLDRTQRQRLARGAQPTAIPGDALWGPPTHPPSAPPTPGPDDPLGPYGR